MSMTRREFLKIPTLASIGWCLPEFLPRSAAAGPCGRDGNSVLVVLQLTGGNDGLNTVVPFTDDAYARNRTTLRLEKGRLHRLTSDLGLHPDMKEFRRLYDDGLLGIVQGVGYPQQSRDHDGGLRVWQVADPAESPRQTGWVGRAADGAWRPDGRGPVPAAFVGKISRPDALNARSVVIPTVRALRDLVFHEPPGGHTGSTHGKGAAGSDPLLDFVTRTDRNARLHGTRLEKISSRFDASGNYPSYPLAGELQQAARLIEADIGIRIIFTELGGGGIGGFDNHANQLGNHCAMLHQLSESVGAFMRDLKRVDALDRVLLMTFSEFGRTLSENGRHGTGHGEAAPMFLAGGKVSAGLIGEHPSLTDLAEDAPKFHTDFRRVYATVLDQWLGYDSQAVLGGTFEPLKLLNL